VTYCYNYSYRSHGLTCISNVPIPHCWSEEAGSTQPDLVLTIGSRPRWVQDAQNLPSSVHYSDPASALIVLGAEQFFQLTYSDGAQFVVDTDGHRLWAGCAEPLTIEYLATYLRGPVMGFVLRRRTVTALHASAVSIRGQAIVLCGESEAGKSTTAAALALRGIPVLCDDVCSLKETEDIAKFQIESGDPLVGLWPDAVRNLLGNPGALTRLTATWEKCCLPLDGVRAKFEAQRRPLGAIYLLAGRVEHDRAPYLEELNLRDALLQLVRNTYMNWILDRRRRSLEFDMLSRLVLHIPVRRIVPHSDSARITDLCDLILDDADRVVGPLQSASLVSND
jgi:hypothetical protein